MPTKWCRMRISLQKLADCRFQKMVGVEGFEPPALWSQTICATRLRYTPNSLRQPKKETLYNWCGREDSNFQGISPTTTSTLRVYQFRHVRKLEDLTALPRSNGGALGGTRTLNAWYLKPVRIPNSATSAWNSLNGGAGKRTRTSTP